MNLDDLIERKVSAYEEWLHSLDKEFLLYEFDDRIGGPAPDDADTVIEALLCHYDYILETQDINQWWAQERRKYERVSFDLNHEINKCGMCGRETIGNICVFCQETI
jgi:hypothetical protein